MVKTLTKKRDFYAGSLMTLIGAGVAFNASHFHVLGSMTHLGPGMFPLILGIALAFVGVLIMGGAVLSPPGPAENILPHQKEWIGWICILSGPILFIVLGDYFGLVPATFACVFVPALGDRTATIKGSAILAAVVTVFGVALFSFVLMIPFPLFKWIF